MDDSWAHPGNQCVPHFWDAGILTSSGATSVKQCIEATANVAGIFALNASREQVVGTEQQAHEIVIVGGGAGGLELATRHGWIKTAMITYAHFISTPTRARIKLH